MTVEQLQRILKAGEHATWGVHDATTNHLGVMFRAMIKECQDIISEQSGNGGGDDG